MLNQINILAISGSLRPNSSNIAILRIIAGMAEDDVIFTIYNGLDRIPHFNPMIDNDDATEPFNQFRTALKESDGVVICTPEYAFGVPGVLKNALDWTVSTGDFDKKLTAVITASSSGDKAHASLLLTFKALGAIVPANGTLLIPHVRTKVSEKGEIDDEVILNALKEVLTSITQAIHERMEAAEMGDFQ